MLSQWSKTTENGSTNRLLTQVSAYRHSYCFASASFRLIIIIPIPSCHLPLFYQKTGIMLIRIFFLPSIMGTRNTTGLRVAPQTITTTNRQIEHDFFDHLSGDTLFHSNPLWITPPIFSHFLSPPKSSPLRMVTRICHILFLLRRVCYSLFTGSLIVHVQYISFWHLKWEAF